MGTKKRYYYGAGGRNVTPVSYWSLVANMALPSVRKRLSFETMEEIDSAIAAHEKREEDSDHG